METEEAAGGGDSTLDSVAAAIDTEIESLVTEGGITADTRGALTVEMLLRVLRWRSAQSLRVYGNWTDDTNDDYPEATLAFARQCEREARHYEVATERLESKGIDVEPLEMGVHGDNLRYMYTLSSTLEYLAVGLFAAQKLRLQKDKQSALVVESNADIRTRRLYRETVLPNQEETIETAREHLRAMIDEGATTPSEIETIALDFFEVARRSQKRAMEETGDIDPKSIC